MLSVDLVVDRLAPGFTEQHVVCGLLRQLARAKESIALFQGLQVGLSLSEVLLTFGRIQQAQGRHEPARESLLQALRLAWDEGPRWLLAASMKALASAVVEGGGMELGVQLIAAATGMRGRMGVPVRPIDRLGIEQALTVARVALREERSAALWSEAQAMSLEQLAATIARDAAFGQRKGRGITTLASNRSPCYKRFPSETDRCLSRRRLVASRTDRHGPLVRDCCSMQAFAAPW